MVYLILKCLNILFSGHQIQKYKTIVRIFFFFRDSSYTCFYLFQWKKSYRWSVKADLILEINRIELSINFKTRFINAAWRHKFLSKPKFRRTCHMSHSVRGIDIFTRLSANVNNKNIKSGQFKENLMKQEWFHCFKFPDAV